MSTTQRKPEAPVLDPSILQKFQEVDAVAASMDPATAARERKRALLQKVRMLRDGQAAKAAEAPIGHPEYVYFWVFNHPDEISNFLQKHAEVVEGSDPVKTDFKADSGRHYKRDTILMRMHKDLSEAWNADRDLRAVEASEGAKTAFEDWGSNQGIPVKRH